MRTYGADESEEEKRTEETSARAKERRRVRMKTHGALMEAPNADDYAECLGLNPPRERDR